MPFLVSLDDGQILCVYFWPCMFYSCRSVGAGDCVAKTTAKTPLIHPVNRPPVGEAPLYQKTCHLSLSLTHFIFPEPEGL